MPKDAKAGQAQHFVSTHSAIYNTHNLQRHLISRKTLGTFVRRSRLKFQIRSALQARKIILTAPNGKRVMAAA